MSYSILNASVEYRRVDADRRNLDQWKQITETTVDKFLLSPELKNVGQW